MEINDLPGANLACRVTSNREWWRRRPMEVTTCRVLAGCYSACRVLLGVEVAARR
jgi:hypothetical protein